MNKKKIEIFISNFFDKNFNIPLKKKDFKKKNCLQNYNIDSMNIMFFLTSLERFSNNKINLNIILKSSLNEIIEHILTQKKIITLKKRR
jgi:hypothetical protein